MGKTTANGGDLEVEKGSMRRPSTQGSQRTRADSCGIYTWHKEEGEKITLMYTNDEKVAMKDFSSEVRASMDVSHFIKQAQLLLDVTETSLEGVVDRMLTALLEKEPLTTREEAKGVLFVKDSVTQLAKTIQGTCGSPDRHTDSSDYDQSWTATMCHLPALQRRHVAIARLKHPANFGRTAKHVKLFVLILVPSKEKGTKNALETARTFATIIADMDFRQRLMEAHTEEEFMQLIVKHTQMMAIEDGDTKVHAVNLDEEPLEDEKCCTVGTGLSADLKRRASFYIQDYVDGFVGNKTLQKTISTTFFLYFACILPSIAFGVLNDHNTGGKIDVKKVIIGQTLGGLFFFVFGGQPLMVLLTTAPLAIYIKIIKNICDDFELDFFSMYCAVGLWNSFFIILYSVFDVSRLMRWSTRSTEEIFALFISIAFCVDATRDTVHNFQRNYLSPACLGVSEEANVTNYDVTNGTVVVIDQCLRENSMLYLLLMLGTLWVGVSLYNFNKTPYLEANKREMLADYALPVAVLVMTFIGSFLFKEVKLMPFHYRGENAIGLVSMSGMGAGAVLGSAGLGFCLSLLFFMDQNISSAMVNNPGNKLKKGPAYHLDLMVVALLNGLLSVFGLPWMHAAIPHSPLHVRSLADVEERIEQGHVYEIIVKVRETRVTGILSHVLIGLSVFLLPYPLSYIPPPVLSGLFLYMAITALNGNQMFERITLLFTEQVAYPPNHYIRRVPQRKIHIFTGCQVVQLCILCAFGFSPWAYMKTFFPVLLLLLLPIRHRLVPKLIEEKYLAAMDTEH
ncbi:sodium bicarbonate transporter-like protein 11 [Pollicipes pollicipes]|uniref:sodium bicarbonate transporter-like protein 11 n=1 Tax=Pollicipes pollicipes TaxID=41117 RepID=UPI00188598D8|nr:sodium bicarbonate transporter-like protein 11 [Pollicipes pollicipes]